MSDLRAIAQEIRRRGHALLPDVYCAGVTTEPMRELARSLAYVRRAVMLDVANAIDEIVTQRKDGGD